MKKGDALTSICFLRKEANSIKEIILKNIIPDSLSYNYSPNFSSNSILGRMSPIQLYTGGSAKTYSFRITLHEDYLMDTKYAKLEDLVDDIKSLSYPIYNNGVVKLPKVDFYIGEISGSGLVQTGISWKKPIRNGRYVLADLSITITVEELFSIPKFEERVITQGDSINVDYTGGVIVPTVNTAEVYWAYPDTFYVGVVASNMGIAFNKYPNVSVNEFVVPIDRLSLEPVIESFEGKLALINNYKKIMDESNINDMPDYADKSTELKESITDMTNVVSNENSLKLISYSSFTTKVNNTKEEFLEYLDYYFWHGNKQMTSDEFDAVSDEITAIFDSIISTYEAVFGYGAGN